MRIWVPVRPIEAFEIRNLLATHFFFRWGSYKGLCRLSASSICLRQLWILFSVFQVSLIKSNVRLSKVQYDAKAKYNFLVHDDWLAPPFYYLNRITAHPLHSVTISSLILVFKTIKYCTQTDMCLENRFKQWVFYWSDSISIKQNICTIIKYIFSAPQSKQYVLNCSCVTKLYSLKYIISGCVCSLSTPL